jgi:predicted enzyme related to lactoylglutathione lyase
MGKQAQRPPELYRIILPVKDIKKASIFYSKLLDLKGKKVSPGRVYFECGQTILACYDPVADGDSLHSGWNLHPKQYIYFSVGDLDSTFEKAKNLRCKRIDNAIKTMPWGERLFYAKDPFNNLICFVDEATVFRG